MVFRVKEGFSFDHQGVPVTVRAGHLLEDDHPWVKGHESHLEPVDDVTGRGSTAAVETTTAAPGSRRTLSRRRGDEED